MLFWVLSSQYHSSLKEVILIILVAPEQEIYFFLHAQVKAKRFCTSSLLFIVCHVHINTYLQENKMEIWKKEYIWHFAFTVQLLYLQYVCVCIHTYKRRNKELVKLETFCSDKKHGTRGFLSLHLSSLLYQYSHRIYCSNRWHNTDLRLRPKTLFLLSVFTGHLTKHRHRLFRSTGCFYSNRNNCLYCNAIPTSRQSGKQFIKLCYSNLPFTFLKET